MLNYLRHYRQKKNPLPTSPTLIEEWEDLLDKLREVCIQYRDVSTLNPIQLAEISTRMRSGVELVNIVTMINGRLQLRVDYPERDTYIDGNDYQRFVSSHVKTKPIFEWLTVNDIQQPIQPVLDILPLLSNSLLCYNNLMHSSQISRVTKDYYHRFIRPVIVELRSIYSQLYEIGVANEKA